MYFQFPSSNFYFRDAGRSRSITSRRLQRAAVCNAIYQRHESRVRVFRVCASQQGYAIFSVTLEPGPEYLDQLGSVDVGKSFSLGEEIISAIVCIQILPRAAVGIAASVSRRCCVRLHCRKVLNISSILSAPGSREGFLEYAKRCCEIDSCESSRFLRENVAYLRRRILSRSWTWTCIPGEFVRKRNVYFAIRSIVPSIEKCKRNPIPFEHAADVTVVSSRFQFNAPLLFSSTQNSELFHSGYFYRNYRSIIVEINNQSFKIISSLFRDINLLLSTF